MARDADVAGGGGNRRLDRLDILAGDVGRRRPDTGVLGAAGDEPAVAGRSTQGLVTATDVDSSQAPVVVWLQGGPGVSSMFGLLEIHGPIQAEGFNPTIAVKNNYTWTNRANMLYIDNPIGAGQFA